MVIDHKYIAVAYLWGVDNGDRPTLIDFFFINNILIKILWPMYSGQNKEGYGGFHPRLIYSDLFYSPTYNVQKTDSH